MAEAGPSKQKHISAPVVDSDSDSESVSSSGSASSNAIDEPEAFVPRKVAPVKKNGAVSAYPKYQPPPGMEPVDIAVSFKSSPFEFENLEKSGMELWAVRIPADVKPSRLSSLKLSSGGNGSLSTKNGEYVLAPADEDTGAEMEGLTLFVPSMAKRGKLVRAPVKIARRVILKPEEKGEGEAYSVPVKRKREQPEHLLKFRNRAFGFDTAGPGSASQRGGKEAMDVDGKEDEDVKEDSEVEDVKEDEEEQRRRREKEEKKRRKLESPRKSKDSPKKEKKSKSKA